MVFSQCQDVKRLFSLSHEWNMLPLFVLISLFLTCEYAEKCIDNNFWPFTTAAKEDNVSTFYFAICKASGYSDV